jgi:hypothetical protein
MQAEDRPLGVLKSVQLFKERGRKLRASDVVLEGLVHVQRAGDELPGAHGASVLESYSSRLASLDHDAFELDLRCEPPAGRDECLHQAARQVGRAALAELVAALQVEGADHRAHGARLGHGVHEPGPEQRDLEQEQELHVFVLEQLLHNVERLALRRREKIAADVTARQQRLALGSWQRLGEALRQEYASRDLLGLAVPVAKGRGVPLGEARDVGERLLEIAPEHERRSVEVWLAELVARRNVGYSVAEAQILEPGCLADVEMIDRMQVVIEAGCRHFLGHECATVL